MLNVGDLVTRLEGLFLTQSGLSAHWSPTTKLNLLNEAADDLYHELIQAFQSRYFCEMDTAIVPISGQINLSGLSKPYYKVIAFQKSVGTGWIDVPIVPQHEVYMATNRDSLEKWFEVGTKLMANNDAVTGTYRIAYHYQRTRFTQNGDVSQFEDGYDEIIPYRAAYIGCLQAKEKEDAQMFAQEYNGRLMRMKETAQRRNNTRYAVKDVEMWGAEESLWVL